MPVCVCVYVVPGGKLEDMHVIDIAPEGKEPMASSSHSERLTPNDSVRVTFLQSRSNIR